MNKFVETYMLAKAAYETARSEIRLELASNPEYQEANRKLTPELLQSSPDEFERLNLFTCEIEVATESSYKRFDLFTLLNAAEELLINTYGTFIRGKKHVPPTVLELFTEPAIKKVLNFPKWRQNLIDIILRTPDF